MDKEDILRRTLEDLNKHYPIGLYEFLYQVHPKLFNELQGIEAEIDNKFLTGSVAELKGVLREYWTFHMKCIDIFRDANIPVDVDNAKEQMMEKRLNA